MIAGRERKEPNDGSLGSSGAAQALRRHHTSPRLMVADGQDKDLPGRLRTTANPKVETRDISHATAPRCQVTYDWGYFVTNLLRTGIESLP